VPPKQLRKSEPANATSSRSSTAKRPGLRIDASGAHDTLC
jgi:hypothetical protein